MSKKNYARIAGASELLANYAKNLSSSAKRGELDEEAIDGVYNMLRRLTELGVDIKSYEYDEN